MVVTLREVTRDDISPLSKLAVAPDQRDFVAHNEYSLAQVHYETGATPYVIWNDDTRVGFCQVIDMRKHEYREPYDDPEALFLWRFMIGAEHQGKGYGKAAMRALIRLAREGGHPAFETSAVTANEAAIGFYEGLGFVPTGRIHDGEVFLRQELG